jgi:hypothetical protein
VTVATIYASIDSDMDADAPDANYGAVTGLRVGIEYQGGSKVSNRRFIAKFDVSSLAGEQIDAAELHRKVTYVVSGGFAAHVGRCTRPATWTEVGVTWNKYNGVDAWTVAGGDIDGALDLAYIEASVTGEHVIYGLKALVDDALANRAGVVAVILRPDLASGYSSFVVFWSREGNPVYGAVPPFLLIDYTPAGGSPADPGRREAQERELAFDNLRGVRARRGVQPRGGVLPRRPLPSLMEV